MLIPIAVNPREGSTSPADVQNAGPGEPATPAVICGGGVHVSVQRVRAVSLPTAGLPLERRCELRWEAAGGSQSAGPCCSQAHTSSPGVRVFEEGSRVGAPGQVDPTADLSPEKSGYQQPDLWQPLSWVLWCRVIIHSTPLPIIVRSTLSRLAIVIL